MGHNCFCDNDSPGKKIIDVSVMGEMIIPDKLLAAACESSRSLLNIV